MTVVTKISFVDLSVEKFQNTSKLSMWGNHTIYTKVQYYDYKYINSLLVKEGINHNKYKLLITFTKIIYALNTIY